jgi:hypothetical protein
MVKHSKALWLANAEMPGGWFHVESAVEPTALRDLENGCESGRLYVQFAIATVSRIGQKREPGNQSDLPTKLLLQFLLLHEMSSTE